ncbi:MULTISPECIES: RNA polymerase sigma factor [Clostridia]|uniref:RNA polymerase sigma factor n=1 Tax=Clostridia TaxID=186801 RepID=UPI00067E868A|nr:MULTISPECIES: HTH domain-containing protein [Clostridia]
MAYNKAREEKKWKQWKEIEEKQMRELGVEEDVISKLWELDWADFNEERRYREHRADFPDYDLLSPVEMEEPELNNVQRLLDTIEDEQLLHIMLEADRETLQLLLLKMIGFSISEISEKLAVPEQTIYTRIRRLREKIKKIRKGE